MFKSPGSIAFSIGNLEIMWYGIIVAVAILSAILVVMYRVPAYGISRDRVVDFAIVVIPAGIIGARLYYVVFNWDYYQGDILKIIDFRAGGLAIHGGLILGMLSAVVLCKIFRMSILNSLDIAVPAIAIAQSIGRWGNFFNEEAHGGPTDLPWAVFIDGVGYHPTFLYESIWCFFLFALLMLISSKRKFVGQLFLLYCILYSVERFFVEGLRTDSLMIGDLKTAQVLSLVIIVVCCVAYFFKNKEARPRIFK